MRTFLLAFVASLAAMAMASMHEHDCGDLSAQGYSPYKYEVEHEAQSPRGGRNKKKQKPNNDGQLGQGQHVCCRAAGDGSCVVINKHGQQEATLTPLNVVRGTQKHGVVVYEQRTKKYKMFPAARSAQGINVWQGDNYADQTRPRVAAGGDGSDTDSDDHPPSSLADSAEVLDLPKPNPPAPRAAGSGTSMRGKKCEGNARRYKIEGRDDGACCEGAQIYRCFVFDQAKAKMITVIFQETQIVPDQAREGSVSADLQTIHPFLPPAPTIIPARKQPAHHQPDSAHDHGAGLTETDECFDPNEAKSFGLLTLGVRANKASQLPCLEQSFQCATKKAKVASGECLPLQFPKQMLYSCKAKCGMITAMLDDSGDSLEFANGVSSRGSHAYEMCGTLFLRVQ